MAKEAFTVTTAAKGHRRHLTTAFAPGCGYLPADDAGAGPHSLDPLLVLAKHTECVRVTSAPAHDAFAQRSFLASKAGCSACHSAPFLITRFMSAERSGSTLGGMTWPTNRVDQLRSKNPNFEPQHLLSASDMHHFTCLNASVLRYKIVCSQNQFLHGYFIP